MSDRTKSLALGIDLGTTSVKVSLLNLHTQEVVCSFGHKSSANVESDVGHLGSEQSPAIILGAVRKCLDEIPADEQRQIVGIGVTGQMHGVMLWNSRDVEKTTHLYTWMDQRCTPEFLATLPQPRSHLRLATGHGNATLFWLSRHRKEIIQSFDSAGTVMDYLVAKLCGLAKPVTSVQVAASMGYFNTQERKWNLSILSENGFPVDLLPEVVSPGEKAGLLQVSLSAIPSDVCVYVGLGDVQCAFLSVLRSSQDAVVNISTSIQIGFISKGDNNTNTHGDTVKVPTVDYIPYFNGDYLALSAGLNGGNVLQQFVLTLQSWMKDLGFSLPETEVWSKLLNMAEASTDPTLSVKPTLYGERHLPSMQGSVSGITASNTSLGEVFKAVCHGVIDNLHTLMPTEFLVNVGHVKRILASGSAITHNHVLQKRLEKVYGALSVVYGTECDSALGVAKIVRIHDR